MSKFVLTAQVQLQAPRNTRQVVNQIQRQLQGVNVNVNVQGGRQTQQQIQQITKATNQATKAADGLGKTLKTSIRRYAGLAIATRAVSLFTNTLSSAIQEAIAFERELIKVVQVTGRSIASLRDLTSEITRLSTAFGASSTSLINVSRVLSQAGLSAGETKTALDALARTTLAPTFDDITQTAEGAVAIFNQFRQGAAALEKQLGAINAVAGRFAVEAGDLIAVIRRTGGVFKAAGGDLNELIALFTSVRATTRESAESIATGLRTIFTRIQRPKTIEFLKEFGVELTDLNGKFVGPFEAIKRLSQALAGLEQGDLQFIRIAEELGGFRQIGKVIPLIQEFRVSQEALNTAIAGSDSLSKDAATAQQALAVRIAKVKEEFLALVREISGTKSFQLMANVALNLASAFLKVADALKPLIPLVAAFAGIKLAKGLGGLLGGAKGALGFNRGGTVPGTGNRDTVPAMLTPGEFVIRKSAVQAFGADNLSDINKYAYGGKVNKAGSFNNYGIKVRDIKDRRKGLARALGNAARGSLLGNMFEGFLYKNFGVTSTVQKFPDVIGANQNSKAIAATGALREGVENVEFKYRGDLEKKAKYSSKFNRDNTDVYSAFNKGGPVGTDTVPALLTPGEFVVNRQSAQSFGYGNLKKINRYAKGGKVQKFANGGKAEGGFGGGAAVIAFSSLQALAPAIDENSTAMQKAANNVLTLATTVSAATVALAAFGIKLSKTAVSDIFKAGFGGNKGVGKAANPLSDLLIKKSGVRGAAFRQREKQLISEGIGKRSARKIAIGDVKSGRAFRGNLRSGAIRGGKGFLGFGKSPAGKGGRGILGFGKSPGQLGGLTKGTKLAAKSLRLFSVGITRVLGPIAALTTISAIVSGFTDFEGRLKDAVKAGDKELASQLAVANANEKAIPLVGGLVSGFANLIGAGDTLAGILTVFGGNTAESTKAAVRSQISSANANKALAEASKVATDAMKDFKDGNISALEALNQIAQAQAPVQTAAQDAIAANTANLENRSTVGNGAIARNIFTLGGLLGETAGQRNRRIGSENAQRTQDATKQLGQSFQQTAPARSAAIRSVLARGGSEADVEAALGGQSASSLADRAVETRKAAQAAFAAGDTEGGKALEAQAKLLSDEAKRIRKETNNIKESIARNRAAIDAMSLGMETMVASTNAAATNLDNFLSRQTLGSNPLEGAIATLEAGVTSAAMGLSDGQLSGAIDMAAASIEKFGGDATKFKENVSAIQQAQKALPDSVKSLQSALRGAEMRGETSGGSARQRQDKIAEIIAGGLKGVGPDVKKRLEDQIKGMDLNEEQLQKLVEGDMSAISEVLNEIGDNALKQVLPALKKQAEIQNKLNSLVQKRLELENQFVEAQKMVIATTLEAAEIAAEFGGAPVTAQQRRRSVLDQANVQGAAAGVGRLTGSSARDLRARNEQVSGRLNQIRGVRALLAQGERIEGAEGEAGIKLAEEEKRLLALNKEQINVTKQLIDINRKELEIIKAKNAEEKSGLEALMAGDFEKFFESQATVGATAAAAIGDPNLMRSFGQAGMAGAVGNLQQMQSQGVTSIFGQQIGGQGGVLEGAAAGALSAFGLEGKASVVAGTTPEEERLKAENRDLAGTLPETAQIQADQAQFNMEAASMQIEAAKMQLEAANKEVQMAQGRAMGGMIYASRGMFVPKGTDTVPAMLTPGEFVVRRSAVQRGNNLQLLKAMNTGASVAGGGGTQTLSRGGQVQYLHEGSKNPVAGGGGGMGVSPEVLNNFSSALKDFNNELQANITKLQGTAFDIKLDTSNINVNLTGTSFINDLQATLKDKVMSYVGEAIKGHSVGPDGKLTKDSGAVA